MSVFDRDYIIKRGDHRSGYYFSPILRRKSIELVSRVVKLNPSMLYDFGGIDNCDVNKIYGYSIGFHHRNSVRLGWSVDKNIRRVQLYAYLYNRGKRIIIKLADPITIANGYRDIECSIRASEKHVHFALYDNRGIFCSEDIPFVFPGGCFWGYWLFPYFGGNNVAPHDVLVPLRDKLDIYSGETDDLKFGHNMRVV